MRGLPMRDKINIMNNAASPEGFSKVYAEAAAPAAPSSAVGAPPAAEGVDDDDDDLSSLGLSIVSIESLSLAPNVPRRGPSTLEDDGSLFTLDTGSVVFPY